MIGTDADRLALSRAVRPLRGETPEEMLDRVVSRALRRAFRRMHDETPREMFDRLLLPAEPPDFLDPGSCILAPRGPWDAIEPVEDFLVRVLLATAALAAAVEGVRAAQSAAAESVVPPAPDVPEPREIDVGTLLAAPRPGPACCA